MSIPIFLIINQNIILQMTIGILEVLICFFMDVHIIFSLKTGPFGPVIYRSISLKANPLTQQRQHVLRNLVSLCQYRGTGLLQNLRAGHVGYFGSVVSIFDA